MSLAARLTNVTAAPGFWPSATLAVVEGELIVGVSSLTLTTFIVTVPLTSIVPLLTL